MSKKYDGKIPFTKEGRLITYDKDFYWLKDAEWKNNEPFYNELIFDGFGRGRSSALAYFKDTIDNQNYPMFLVDFQDLIKNYGISNENVVKGSWVFAKRGCNYAIKYYGKS